MSVLRLSGHGTSVRAVNEPGSTAGKSPSAGEGSVERPESEGAATSAARPTRSGAKGGQTKPGISSTQRGKKKNAKPVAVEADAPPVADEVAKDAYVVALPTFEGPLDLLLHLIQKHELDILDIPVSFITEKYLTYLNMMKELTIDVASEYLVMAATLTHIKSKMLLPDLPSDQGDGTEEEELDPREELVRRLLEYQKYKAAAEDLGNFETLGKDVFPRGASEPVEELPPPFVPFGVFDLLGAFSKILEKTKSTTQHEVVFDRISITDRIVELTDVLKTRRSVPFEELFGMAVSTTDLAPRVATRFDVVITFLAILEMCRMRMMRVYQAESLSPIHVELLVMDEDESAREGDSLDDLPLIEELAAKEAQEIADEASSTDTLPDESGSEDASAQEVFSDEEVGALSESEDQAAFVEDDRESPPEALESVTLDELLSQSASAQDAEEGPVEAPPDPNEPLETEPLQSENEEALGQSAEQDRQSVDAVGDPSSVESTRIEPAETSQVLVGEHAPASEFHGAQITAEDVTESPDRPVAAPIDELVHSAAELADAEVLAVPFETSTVLSDEALGQDAIDADDQIVESDVAAVEASETQTSLEGAHSFTDEELAIAAADESPAAPPAEELADISVAENNEQTQARDEISKPAEIAPRDEERASAEVAEESHASPSPHPELPAVPPQKPPHPLPLDPDRAATDPRDPDEEAHEA